MTLDSMDKSGNSMLIESYLTFILLLKYSTLIGSSKGHQK